MSTFSSFWWLFEVPLSRIGTSTSSIIGLHHKTLYSWSINSGLSV